MDIASIFYFLVKDFGMNYQHQEFRGCYGGHWNIYTYSYYNESGCFTIHTLPQRGELDFYYSHIFATERELLCERIIDIRLIESEIWDKYTKIGRVNNPFFWWSKRRVLTVLAEVIKVHVSKYGEFLGIQVVTT